MQKHRRACTFGLGGGGRRDDLLARKNYTMPTSNETVIVPKIVILKPRMTSIYSLLDIVKSETY